MLPYPTTATTNVATMTTAQWYRVLVEQEITMVNTDTAGSEYIKSRAELASPETDWEKNWRLARIKGLGSEATSFLWKMLHNILPTEQRLARILPNSIPACKFCPTPNFPRMQSFNIQTYIYESRALTLGLVQPVLTCSVCRCKERAVAEPVQTLHHKHPVRVER